MDYLQIKRVNSLNGVGHMMGDRDGIRRELYEARRDAARDVYGVYRAISLRDRGL